MMLYQPMAALRECEIESYPSALDACASRAEKAFRLYERAVLELSAVPTESSNYPTDEAATYVAGQVAEAIRHYREAYEQANEMFEALSKYGMWRGIHPLQWGYDPHVRLSVY